MNLSLSMLPFWLLDFLSIHRHQFFPHKKAASRNFRSSNHAPGNLLVRLLQIGRRERKMRLEFSVRNFERRANVAGATILIVANGSCFMVANDGVAKGCILPKNARARRSFGGREGGMYISST